MVVLLQFYEFQVELLFILGVCIGLGGYGLLEEGYLVGLFELSPSFCHLMRFLLHLVVFLLLGSL
jgi:hypothetical protein